MTKHGKQGENAAMGDEMIFREPISLPTKFPEEPNYLMELGDQGMAVLAGSVGLLEQLWKTVTDHPLPLRHLHRMYSHEQNYRIKSAQ